MLRRVILFLLFTFVLSAETVHFKEERYLYALDKRVIRKGTIRSSREGLEILYDKDGQSLLYHNDTLIITEGKQRKTVDLDHDPVMKIFFVLLNAIFHDDTGRLGRFFTIQSRDGERILSPKKPISAKLIKVIYRKRKRLDYLRIYLKNGDRISIEQSK